MILKKSIIFFAFFFLPNFFFSAISPHYKEAMQRGYEIIEGDKVVMPDGTICNIKDFNEGNCGKKWFGEEYCVPEGKYVWDEDKCCEGLAPFLPEDVSGQATCQPIDDSWFTSKSLMYFFVGVLIPLGLFVFLAIKAKKNLSKNNS